MISVLLLLQMLLAGKAEDTDKRPYLQEPALSFWRDGSPLRSSAPVPRGGGAFKFRARRRDHGSRFSCVADNGVGPGAVASREVEVRVLCESSLSPWLWWCGLPPSS